MTKEPTLRDWLVIMAISGLLGAILGPLFGGILSWKFWACDIPILLFINWWFIWRQPKNKEKATTSCVCFLCKNDPVDGDVYCEKHRI